MTKTRDDRYKYELLGVISLLGAQATGSYDGPWADEEANWLADRLLTWEPTVMRRAAAFERALRDLAEETIRMWNDYRSGLWDGEM